MALIYTALSLWHLVVERVRKITGRWCLVQIIEVIREHRFYEKKFVVETRPAGERELTNRQNVRILFLTVLPLP